MKWLNEERDAYLLGLARLLLGVLLCIQAWQRFSEVDALRYFGDHFHLPFVPEAWVPTLDGYRALLALEVGCGLLAIIGKFGREALLVGAGSGIFLMLCDRLQYHNNRFSLFLCCFLCAFCPADRSFLLYRWRNHALDVASRIAPTLPRRLLALQVSLLYLASGGGKALDPDWRSGQTMLLRFRAGIEDALAQGVSPPSWLADVMTAPWFASVASKTAISLELALALGLWLPRTRVLALWGGALFHVSIEASARVELFSWLMGAAYIAFVTPEIRERTVLVDPTTTLGRVTRSVLPFVDWLARFRVAELSAAERGGGSVVVVDRDGRRASGRAVPAGLARGIPLVFVIWPALVLLAWGRRSGATAMAPRTGESTP